MTSFGDLLALHQKLDDLFFEHQRALMRGDFENAVVKLAAYEDDLLTHMTDEEEFLLPVYAARADIPMGGSAEIFCNEHGKIKQYLRLIMAEIPKLPDAMDPERAILFLLDSEVMFKKLMVHHDARERKILYPLLDQVTSVEERESLFRKLRASMSDML